MNTISKLINIVATGFIVTVLLCLILFFGREFCYAPLMHSLLRDSNKIRISPSGLIPGEEIPKSQRIAGCSTDTNAIKEPHKLMSRAYSEIQIYPNLVAFGIGEKMMELERPYTTFTHKEKTYYWVQDKDNYLFFNNQNGLFVLHQQYSVKTKEQDNVKRSQEYYAGPEGMSLTPSASLGRFEIPIVSKSIFGNRILVYDKYQRCFFLINFNNGIVSKGPVLAQGDTKEPIEIGDIRKNAYLYLGWEPPSISQDNGNSKPIKINLPDSNDPDAEWNCASSGDFRGRYFIALSKTGQIYLIDTNNWSMKDAGYLPVPETLFSTQYRTKPAQPEKLLSYRVGPVFAYLSLPDKDKRYSNIAGMRYLGLCAASLSREGTSQALAVFDANGTLIHQIMSMMKDIKGSSFISINQETYYLPKETSTAKAIYYIPQWSSVWTTFEYLIENLQPPALEIASYFCGDCFEASDGIRAIFILPNTFMGMAGRAENFGEGLNIAKREILILLLMAPSLILSIGLGINVRRDAAKTGYSNKANNWWLAGTIAFGLPAYITYRLTKPKEVLVTCQNCGKMRRPDMEKCHRCGSGWEIPELQPPAWRISD